MALYRAKEEGRGTFRFFEPEMDARMKARRALELDLRQALNDGAFDLHYQPLVDVETGEVTCCEALLRWNHPKRGMISPAEFVPVAEEMGLIVPLGEWVLRKACTDAAAWPEDVRLAVNLSPTQIAASELVSTLLSALAYSGLAPNRLEIEITEEVLMHNTKATLDTLHQVRELGVRISLDDFGTGFSSLSYLRSFPFDKIKIDRCFIGGLPDGDSRAIVRAIVDLASSLNMVTTAEGVETEQQAAEVRALGCAEMQGFLISRPKPLAEMSSLFLQPKMRSVGVA
jgi:EAL domain-containing protein (putative c-di-GMP-specific phosphodiesterase class I)